MLQISTRYKKIPSTKSQIPNPKEHSKVAWADKFTGIFWELVF